MAAKKKQTEEEAQREAVEARAQEIRGEFHHGKGVDSSDLKSWDELSGDKKARWVREAEEDLGITKESD